MKKTYIMPTILVEKGLVEGFICTSINDVEGNANLNYGGGSTDEARTKEDTGSWEIDW